MNANDIALDIVMGNYGVDGYNIQQTLRNSGMRSVGAAADTAIDARDREEYVSISRQMAKTNLLCQSAVGRAGDHILGPAGINPLPNTGFTGIDQKIKEDVWGVFAENPELTGKFNWRELQEIIFRDTWVAGDQLLSKLGDQNGRDAGKLQHIEAERVRGHEAKRDDGTRVNQGRVLNKKGQTVRWRVSKVGEHGYLNHSDHTEIPARHCEYVYGAYHRSSQVRGLPQWIAALPVAHQVADIMTSEAISWQTASRILASIVNESDKDYGTPAITETDTEKAKKSANELTRTVKDTGYAMIFQGRQGEKFQLTAQNRPSSNFEKNLKLYISLFCLPLGIAQELLMLDFGGMNYSSFRGMLLQAFVSFRRQQINLIDTYDRIYKWQVDRAIAKGLLTWHPTIYNHTWDIPGWPWIDEDKEVKAWAQKIDRGIATQRQALSSLGTTDVDEHRRRRKQEIVAAWDTAKEIEEETNGGIPAGLIWKQFAGMSPSKTAEAAAQAHGSWDAPMKDDGGKKGNDGEGGENGGDE